MTTTTYPDYELNAKADFEAGRYLNASLHTGDPTTVGDHEATGGSPAYARKALTFSLAGAQGPLGAVVQPATVGIAWCDSVVVDLPSGTYGWIGLWGLDGDGGSPPVLRATKALTTPVVVSSQGQVAFAFGVGPAAA